jgi:hypothetical protein
MSSFSVCWNRVRLEWRNHPERAPWAQEAVLCERVLLEGKPTLKIVCRIARVIEDRIGETSERDRFWHSARARLGRLHRLSPRDRLQVSSSVLAYGRGALGPVTAGSRCPQSSRSREPSGAAENSR